MSDWTSEASDELKLPVLESDGPADTLLFEPGPSYALRVQLPESWDANGSPVEAA